MNKVKREVPTRVEEHSFINDLPKIDREIY